MAYKRGMIGFGFDMFYIPVFSYVSEALLYLSADINFRNNGISDHNYCLNNFGFESISKERNEKRQIKIEIDEARGSVGLKALCYKPEGRGFASR
jgi:hypothetical protein